MGASHSVELMAEQESTQPGMMSIISGPLDALDPPISREEAYEETIALLKYPMDPITEGLKKDLQVTQQDANTFVMKLILDGKKLDSFGYGKGDGTDRVRFWKKVTCNRDKFSITVQDYVPERELGAWVTEAKEEVKASCEINFLQDPPQIEFCVDQEGKRWADPETRDGLYSWTDNILGGLHAFKTAKVKVIPDQPSIKEKGLKSMVSEPMDEHVSYENFFPQMVKFTKDFLGKVPNMTLDESDGEIRGSVTNEQGEVTKHVVKFDEAAGEMSITMIQQDKVRAELHRKVHRSPLVVEAWDLDAEGQRLTGSAKAKEIQKNVNVMIDKANSWFG